MLNRIRKQIELPKFENIRILLVSSVGGHLTDLLALTSELDARGHELIYVVNDLSPVLPEGVEVYRIRHGERDWGVVINILEIFRILIQEQPDAIVSTGASPAVSAALAARAIGIPIIYIEPCSSVTNLSLTGKIMRLLADSYFVQWKRLIPKVPRARYYGRMI